MAAISAGLVSLVPGGALGTNTMTTSSAIVSPTWVTPMSSIPDNSELAQRIQDAAGMLNTALGAVVIGLVLAAM